VRTLREEVNAVALVRVYCGVATAELAPWLTVAVVDDSGRLLDVRHISDDPSGYAHLVALLADRSTGSPPVAVDRHEHIVAQLLAAADRPLSIADELSLRDFADRYVDETSYDEMQGAPSQRCAVGLARALQAGALYATAQSPSWDLDELKPVLSAHAALVAGRHGCAVALREVLRELYPAALRAYLDPAELIPLKVLEAFPEPGLLAAAHGQPAVVAELTASGLTDPTTAANAVNALRAAVEESRVRSNPFLAPAVAEAVRQAVAAVRACDTASSALVASLADRLGAMLTGVPARPAPAAPVSPAVPRPVSAAEMAPTWAMAGAVAGAVDSLAHGIPAPRTEPAYAPARADWSEAGGRLAAAAGARAYAAPRGAPPAGPAPLGSPSRGSAPVGGGVYGSGSGGSGRGGGWEQQFGPAPTSPGGRTYGPDTLSFSMDPLTAPLEAPTAGGANGHGTGPTGRDGAPDEDLLIFSQANSVWFTNADDDTLVTWTNLSSDDGWRAAGQIAEPSVGPDTTAGLPRRVPQANLVPGSIAPAGRTPRIVRDPRRLAAHTEGYFRGWRRGQEVGGFTVGQRDRTAWEFNREQRARQGAARLS
jgi:hypothetical protein